MAAPKSQLPSPERQIHQHHFHHFLLKETQRKVQDQNMPLLPVRWLVATQRTELSNSQGGVPQHDDSTCKNAQLPAMFRI